MGAKLLAAIEALKKTPWVVLALLFASIVGGLAQFTNAFKGLADLVHPARADPRAELARLGVPFTPEAMATAAKNGDERVVGLLLNAGMPADVGMPKHLDDPVDDDSPLVAAAARQQDKAFDALVDAGGDFSRTNDAGWSAFDLAAMQGREEPVRHVLARHPGQAAIAHAFRAAAWGGRDGVTTARFLAPLVADLPRRASDSLAEIAGEKKRGVAPMVRLLVSLGANPRAIDDQGVAALHSAAAHGEIEFVQALLAAGAPIEMPGKCFYAQKEPSTALWCATDYGDRDATAFLLKAGANPNARGPEGTTPLVRAAERLESLATIDLLLAAGADPTVRTADGKTVLQRAREAQNPHSGDPAVEAAIFKRLAEASSAAARRRS